MTDRLSGGVALVTGGGHRIGAAICQSLAASGCSVVVHYGTSSEAARATADRLHAEHGVRTWTLQADLAEPEQIERLFSELREACGRLDVLVNSAASFDRAPLAAIDAARWDRTQAINVRAPHLCIREARELLIESAESGGAASVVNIADLGGVFAWRGYAHHAVSKAALLHLTRCAALELAPGIRVNAIVPGAILPPPGVSTESTEWRTVGTRLPLRRPGEPSDIGDAVVFLASAPYVTGETLFVDGGEHLYGNNKR